MPTINDNYKKYKSLFSTTLSTGIGTGTGDTITLSSVSGLPTDTAITLTFDRVDSSGIGTAIKLERIKGIISGGNFTAYVRAIDGTTEQAHTAGAVIEMVWNADDWNNSVDAFLTQHTQSGTHGAITATSAAIVGNVTASTINVGASAAIVGNVTASAINVGASTAVTGVLDEDTMSSNSAVKLATQQSIKAYVDTPRILSATSYTTDTGTSLNIDNLDQFIVTAQAGALLFNAPSGTPKNGQKFIIRIKDDATARALTWNAIFRAMGTALPSTTVLSKTKYLGFIYNSTNTKWDLVASADEA